MAKISSAPSAGREVDDEPNPGGRVTRSRSREASQEPAQTGGGGRQAAKKRGRKANDLASIEETGDDEAQLQADALAADEQEAALAIGDDLDAARRSVSRMSGTTARTAFSQEEIRELDPDIMVDVLPNLATAAQQLTALLIPSDPQARPIVWKEIRTQGSRQSKIFAKRVELLELQKNDFGTQEYIEPSIVVRGLLGVQSMDEVPAAPWRPDNIIYLVNLAQMLRTILVTVPSLPAADKLEALAALETHFAHSIAGPQFDEEAVKTRLAIQTQLSIMRVSHYATVTNVNPSEIIVDTFYNRDGDGDLVYKWVDELHMRNLDATQAKEWTAQLEDLVAEMHACFHDGVDGNALDALLQLHPWTECVDQVIRYFEMRKVQLDQHIAAVGGLNNILQGLAAEVERRADAKIADEKRQSFVQAGGTPKKGFGKGAIAQLKAREKRLSQTSAPPHEGADGPSIVEGMDPQLVQGPHRADAAPQNDNIHPDDDDYTGKSSVQQNVRSGLAELSGFQNQQRQQSKKKGKGRSLMDRQDNAVRIDFDDSQSPQRRMPGEADDFQMPGRSSAPGPYPAISSSSSAKRSYGGTITDTTDAEDFDPTQDEGFQTDQRDTTAADARRRSAPKSSQPARPHREPAGTAGPVNWRGRNPLDDDFPESASGHAAGSPAKRQRKNPGSSFPPPMPPLDPEDGAVPQDQLWELAKTQAKIGRIATTQNRRQARQPWNADEENALIDLIVEHGSDGISWAALKVIDQDGDQRLERRDPESMRFKARNMKVTFVLGHAVLPANWDKVVLDKKAIDKLRDRGIQYHQDPIRNHEG